MKIATGKGDDGFTRLHGKQYAKDDPVIEALGTLDELNSVLGLAYLYEPHFNVRAELRELQDRLLACCQWLAARASEQDPPEDIEPFLEDLGERCRRLEGEVGNFARPVLPGDQMSATYLDHARTIARRVERRLVTVARQSGLDVAEMLALMNRLSDYLWLLARRSELHPH